MKFVYGLPLLIALGFGINTPVYAQDEEWGCSPASLQTMVAAYQLAVLDEGVDEDPDGDIPVEDAAADPYAKLGKALQSLHRAGVLGTPLKMPEVILGQSSDLFLHWAQLFGDKNTAIKTQLLAISGAEELQDILDSNDIQCRDLKDICNGISKVKKLKPAAVKQLSAFLKSGILQAWESTGEIDAADLKAAKTACAKADKKIKTLLKKR